MTFILLAHIRRKEFYILFARRKGKDTAISPKGEERQPAPKIPTSVLRRHFFVIFFFLTPKRKSKNGAKK